MAHEASSCPKSCPPSVIKSLQQCLAQWEGKIPASTSNPHHELTLDDVSGAFAGVEGGGGG